MTHTTGIDAVRLASLAAQLSDMVAANAEPSITFGELFTIYYEKHAQKRNRAPQNAMYFFQRHGAVYADTPVNELTQRQLQDWVDAISDDRGSAGAKRAIDMLSAVINWGIRRGYVNIYTNPCRAVDRHAPKARTRFMKPQEIARLADALRDELPLWRDFVWVSLFTGARRGNVLAMRWADIDFDLAQWRIPETKNGDELIVALTRPAVALLKRRRSEADPRNPWVFPGVGDDHIKEPKRMWQRVCKRAGFTDLRIHDLRRTLASYLAMQGASQYQIGKALGHLDPRSTAVYARLDLNGVRNELEKAHEGWLLNCVNELPAEVEPAPSLLPAPAIHKQAANAEVRISPPVQAVIEGRIVVSIRRGLKTKKHFYRTLGGKLKVNARELDRILHEMEDRGIVRSARDQSDPRWPFTYYQLCG